MSNIVLRLYRFFKTLDKHGRGNNGAHTGRNREILHIPTTHQPGHQAVGVEILRTRQPEPVARRRVQSDGRIRLRIQAVQRHAR